MSHVSKLWFLNALKIKFSFRLYYTYFTVYKLQTKTTYTFRRKVYLKLFFYYGIIYFIRMLILLWFKIRLTWTRAQTNSIHRYLVLIQSPCWANFNKLLLCIIYVLNISPFDQYRSLIIKLTEQKVNSHIFITDMV